MVPDFSGSQAGKYSAMYRSTHHWRVSGWRADELVLVPPGLHSAGALHPGRASTCPRRSTRPGCEWLPVRFAPRRCSYKKAGQPLSPGRSTRPGCEWLRVRFAPRRCSYKKAGQPLSPGRSTRPGCEGCLPGSHRGGAPTKKPANLSPSVGAPAPGANGCVPVRTEAVLLQKGGQPPSLGRSTRPGCEGCLAGSHRGGAPTKKPPNPSPPVGAPVPGAKGAARMPADKTSSSKVSTLMLEPHREN